MLKLRVGKCHQVHKLDADCASYSASACMHGVCALESSGFQYIFLDSVLLEPDTTNQEPCSKELRETSEHDVSES